MLIAGGSSAAILVDANTPSARLKPTADSCLFNDDFMGAPQRFWTCYRFTISNSARPFAMQARMIPTAFRHGCHIFLLEHRSLYCRQPNKAKMIMIFKFCSY
jgi:hypothetical protein